MVCWLLTVTTIHFIIIIISCVCFSYVSAIIIHCAKMLHNKSFSCLVSCQFYALVTFWVFYLKITALWFINVIFSHFSFKENAQSVTIQLIKYGLRGCHEWELFNRPDSPQKNVTSRISVAKKLDHHKLCK